MKGNNINPNYTYAKVAAGYSNYNQAYSRQDTMPDYDSGPLISQPGRDGTMAEYLSGIPDPIIRAFISDLAKKKISETHVFLDWISKAINHLSNHCTGFLDTLSQHLKSSNKMISTLEAKFIQSNQQEMELFKTYISKNGFVSGYKSKFEDEIKFEASISRSKHLTKMLEELRDLGDYKHHLIMQKLVVKKFHPAPVIQDMNKVVQILKFDKLHKDSVNCVDIDPFGKLLVTASSDGTIKFIDLETMKSINELVIRPRNHHKIKAVCIDDKHNVAYVDETNMLSIYSIEQGKVIAEYKGGNLSELTDIIPNQACQFTSDFNYLAFRSEADKIVLFDMLTKGLVKEYKSTDKIHDFTISPQRDYIAFAIYSECMTEIHNVRDGNMVIDLKLESKPYFNKAQVLILKQLPFLRSSGPRMESTCSTVLVMEVLFFVNLVGSRELLLFSILSICSSRVSIETIIGFNFCTQSVAILMLFLSVVIPNSQQLVQVVETIKSK